MMSRKGDRGLRSSWTLGEEHGSAHIREQGVPLLYHVWFHSAAAGKGIIVSNEGLVGQRVRKHNLGRLFPTSNTEKLKKCIHSAALLTESRISRFQHAALRYAKSWSREAFGNIPSSSFKHFKTRGSMVNG